ncbi:hypothetical protein B1218_38755, partial [Pseudomonas ogarae]
MGLKRVLSSPTTKYGVDAQERHEQIDKLQRAGLTRKVRVSPFVRLKQTKKLHRRAVLGERMVKGLDGKPLFKGFSSTVEAGERVAIIGPNGIGKTTL